MGRHFSLPWSATRRLTNKAKMMKGKNMNPSQILNGHLEQDIHEALAILAQAGEAAQPEVSIHLMGEQSFIAACLSNKAKPSDTITSAYGCSNLIAAAHKCLEQINDMAWVEIKRKQLLAELAATEAKLAALPALLKQVDAEHAQAAEAMSAVATEGAQS